MNAAGSPALSGKSPWIAVVRPLLHLVSLTLVLPVLALACAFVILGRAIAAGSLPALLMQLVEDAVWIVPWGILGAGAALIAIALGGMFARTRRLAGLCVAVLGVGSTAVVLVLIFAHSGMTPDQLPFFVPGAIATGIGGWLAWSERPGLDARRDGPGR